MGIRCESCGERATDTSCGECIEEGEELAYQRGFAACQKQIEEFIMAKYRSVIMEHLAMLIKRGDFIKENK
jgi:hypothetical protein